MEPYRTVAEEIDAAQRESARTGNRIRRRIEKRRFLEEFPHAASSPLMALTDPVFDLDFTPLETLTVGQLRNMMARITPSWCQQTSVIASRSVRKRSV
jgi:hypothetical protein